MQLQVFKVLDRAQLIQAVVYAHQQQHCLFQVRLCSSLMILLTSSCADAGLWES